MAKLSGVAAVQKLGFGRVVRSGAYLVGVDKFGHFFNQGFDYFQAKRKNHQNLLEVIDIGTNSEEGFLGLHMTGIKSYADLAANFNGYLFWSQFLDPTTDATQAYVACEERTKWVQVRTFDILDYLDGSWDEGVNCNEYRSKKYAQAVSKAIRELENQSGRKYSCPVYPEDCASLKIKYGPYAIKLLHPLCIRDLEIRDLEIRD